MKFSSREDIEAPIGQVFDMLADFVHFERLAIRRGIEVQRTGTRRAGARMTWHASFDLRGKRREMDLELTTFDRPNQIVFESDTQGLEGVATLDLVALSPQRTRLVVAVELKPKTLSARLLVQSLKLAKANLSKRFKLRVADYARNIEERAKGTRTA